jgi:CRP-like cAMP-binding protein
MPLGKIVCEPGSVLRHVYFPIDCIISFLYLMKDGASTEIAVVGNEGLVGVALFTGAERTLSRKTVRRAGGAYLLAGESLKREVDQGGELQAILLRYTQALLTQIAQTAACNLHHAVDQRLCRSLLAYLDRMPSNQLMMTQELISNMLGVRREGINSAVAKLRQLGAIRCSRGRITVMDRSKLERECCECYTLVKEETNRLAFHERAERQLFDGYFGA